YVFLKRDNDNFDYGAVFRHFNTCHQYKFVIDKSVVTTTDGGSGFPAREQLDNLWREALTGSSSSDSDLQFKNNILHHPSLGHLAGEGKDSHSGHNGL
ncbi:hypothetical protein J6590_106584, partial [Homalodisca vitripennis]